MLSLLARSRGQPVKIACSALLEQQLCFTTAFPLLAQADMYNAAVLKVGMGPLYEFCRALFPAQPRVRRQAV